MRTARPGDRVTVTAMQVKNGKPIGRIVDVLLPNGQKLAGRVIDQIVIGATFPVHRTHANLALQARLDRVDALDAANECEHGRLPHVPMLMHFAEKDQYVPQAAVEQVQVELQQVGRSKAGRTLQARRLTRQKATIDAARASRCSRSPGRR